jgi:hypothetical protein
VGLLLPGVATLFSCPTIPERIAAAASKLAEKPLDSTLLVASSHDLASLREAHAAYSMWHAPTKPAASASIMLFPTCVRDR